ncbi:MAG: glycosyltransferase family 4 protein [Planctomycetes bacterium]|nr:glycosyltransferase family 4 protein [Planctomycetota bacterium]
MPTLAVALDYRPALLSRGGIARATRELAAGLAAAGEIDLHLLGHSLARARVAARIPCGARLHRLPIPGRLLPLLARVGLPAERLAGRARVVHWTDYVQPPVGRAGVLLTVHDTAFAEDPAFHGAESAALLARTRAAARRASLVVTPTEASAAAAMAHLGVARGRVRVVPFGADHVPAPADSPPPLGGRPYFVTVGTIEPRKNHERLLAAHAALGPAAPLLVAIGAPGWECGRAVAALRAAQAAGRVLWLRRAADAEVWRYLAHARALAYPSLLEGFGFPPLEALRLGTPVLAGDVPALREVLGGHARFCDPRDVEAIRSALAELAEGGAALRSRVAAGRAWAQRYTWRRCAQQHAALYAEVAA